jgi:hypothetical protein
LNGSDISGATGASYTTPALAAGTYTYRRRSRYCTSFTGSVQDVYSTSFTITVQSTVNNPGAISVPATSCAGNAVNITNVTAATTGSPASSGPNYYFYYRGGPSNVGWTMYNGPTTSSTVALPTAVTNTPGNWFVARNSKFGCTGEANNSTTLDIPITIQSLSTAPTSANVDNANICVGGNANISQVGGSLGTGASYKWYTGSCGGTLAGTGASINVAPIATTTYFVSAEGTCNTTTCAQVTVNVNPDPTAPSATKSPAVTTVCAGTSLTLTNPTVGPSGGTGTFTYEYRVNGGAIVTAVPTIVTNSSSAATQTIEIRTSSWTGNGCNPSPWTAYTWTVDQFTAANAASDQTTCGTTATLAGNSPTTGDGTWTLIGGTGSITNPTSPFSGVTGLGVGPNTFRWTLLNGVCADTQDEVVITRDNTPPAVTCKSAVVTLDAAGIGTLSVADVENSSSDACGIATKSINNTAFTCSNVGANTVILTVTDINGNISTCNASVTVQDVTAPNAVCQDITVDLDASPGGLATVTGSQINNGSTDACGIVSYSVSPSTFTCANVGANIVTLTVTDINNNTSTCNATVTIQDVTIPNVSPLAQCLPNVTVSIGKTQVTITPANLDNGSYDNCGFASLVVSPSTFDCSHIGTSQTVTLTGTDASGNSSSCTSQVNIVDDIVPEAICKNIIIQLDNTGNASIIASDVNNLSTDNCGIASLSININSFNCITVGDNLIALTVIDNYSNSSLCNAIVTVEDNVAPVAICQDVTVQLDATGNGSITAIVVDNGSSDACGIQSLVLSQTAFVCSEVGANVETLTVTDNNGNSNTCTATVTVEDNVAPVAICQDVTVQLDATGNGSTTATAVDNGSSDACGIASLVLSQTAFGCSEVGVNTKTLTVTDVNGNVTTCTATITVEDNIAPVAICQDVTVQLDATGNGSTTATTVDNGSSDACGIASLVLSQTAFVCSEVGANVETLTVTDNNGNSNTCTATVTVEDNVAPIAICQDVTVQLDATGNGSTTGNAVDKGSSDACGIASLALSQTAFVCSEVGANTETLTVTDVNGNITTCTATITVEDNVAPVAICQDVTVQLDATGNGSTTATAVDNGSSDACGIASLVLSQTAFVCSEVGANTETLTVTDVNGNVTTCTATITVEDNVAPIAICQDVTVQLDATGNGSTTATAVDNGSSDACGIASLVLSQTAFGCSEVGANTETLTVTDVNGNVTTCTATITVEDNVAPVAICQDVTVQLDATGNGSTTATTVDNGSSDACGIASLVLSQTAFVCSEVGANVETLTVTDNNGNSNTCTATVTVEDNVAPIAICQDVTVQLDATGNGSTTANAVDKGSSDACGIASLALSQTAFGCSEVGANTETLTVTDVNGNITTCTATITVEDNVAPVITSCPANQTVNNDLGLCSANLSVASLFASDACGVLSIVNSKNGTSNASGVYLVGTTTLNWTVTDINGNVSTCSNLITVIDDEPPVIVTCPADIFRPATTGLCSRVVNLGTVSATDNCGIQSITNSYTGTSSVNTSFPVGISEVIWTVTDIHGNESNCETFVLIIDNQAPTAICQPLTVNLNSSGFASITPSQVDNGSTDNCSIISTQLSNNIFTCANVGSNTITLSVIDNSGNVGTCNSLVTVIDNIAPVALCQNVTVFLDANGLVTVPASQVDNGSSDACGIASRVIDIANYTCSNLGSSNPVTLTVTDNNGNISTCNSIITVLDNLPPVAICNNFTIALDANGAAIVTGLDFSSASTDNCSIVTRLVNASNFTCADLGVNPATVILTDQSGNNSFCFPTLTVIDNLAPAITCPSDITVNTDAGQCGAIVSFNATATDNCTVSSVLQSSGITSGTQFPVATSTVGFTATDQSGNMTSCTFTVTVNDVELPNAICQDVTVQLDATGNGSTTATAVDNGSSDACGIASLVLSQTAFVCSEVGANTETLTVTDVNGNVTTCTAIITVEDNIAPVAICQDVTVQLDATGNGSTTATEVDNGSSDACGIANLVLSQTAFVCSEVGANTETLTVTDVNGNVTTCTATITVEDNIAPVAICQDVTVQLDATGNGSTTATAVDNGSSDACGIASLVLNQTDFVCAEVGENTVTLTVTDVNGNITTCDALVTVEDNIAPIAICQDVTVQLDATGNGSTTAALVDNGSSDACVIASLVLSQTAFNCSEVGDNIVTLTVTDLNGNSSACTATVTVEDNVASVAICQDVTVQLDATGNGSTTATAVNNGSTDACGIASIVLSQTAFVCSEVGANTETLTVTDVNGNVSTCTTTVTVEDNIAPVALCQDVTVQLDATGNGSTTATAVNNGSSDACGIASLVLSQTAFVCSEVGANTETLTVTDLNGNVTTCTTTITVQDNVAPVAVCQNVTVTLNALGTGSTTAIAVNNGSSDACGIASLALSQTIFICSEVGANTETLTVTDVNGNVSTCTTTVTVVDNTAPVAICQNVSVNLDATGNGSTTASAVNNGSSDACGIASLALSQTAFTCANVSATAPTDLIISEYIEGSGNNKFIEIFNGTAAPINLSGYQLSIYVNGSSSPTTAGTLTGTVPAGGTAVFKNSSATGPGTSLTNLTFNGNDAVALRKTSGVFVDIIGRIGNDPGTQWLLGGNSTLDRTLRRKSSVTAGITVSPTGTGAGAFTTLATEWDGFATDVTSGLGSHSVTIGTPVTLTVTDVNGNVSTCSASVTVRDLIAPVAVCQDVTVQLNASGNGSTTAAAVNNGSSDACGIASIVLSQTAFNCSEVGANTETLTVTDLNGNISTCTTTITVQDNIAPVALCQNVTVTLSAAGAGSTTAAAVNNGSSDACGIASLVLSQTAFTCANIGPNPVTLTVTDVNSNVNTCSATVTVVDNTAPIAVCQNVTVNLDATGNGSTTAAAVNNGSSDACGIASLVLSQTAFTCANISTAPAPADLIISEYVEGSGNNKYIEIFNGTVSSINLSGYQLSLYVNGSSSPTSAGTLTGTIPAGGTAVFKNSSASGAGTSLTNLTFNGNDAVALRKTSGVFVDIIGRIGNDPGTQWISGSHSTLDKTLRRKSSVTSGVTVSPTGTGPGAFTTLTTEWDVFATDVISGLGAHNVSSGGANSVTLTVTDVNGNVSTCSAVVTVVDAVAPVAVCQDVTVQLNASGNGSTTATAVNNGSSDACGIESIVLSQTAFNCSEVGANTETLTVTDIHGNVSTCTATITVEDNITPVALCQNVTVQLDATGNGSTTAAAVNNGSSDACGIASIVLSQTAFNCSEVGANTETLTVTDVNGNVSTCATTVTVEDNVVPVALCQDVTVQLDATGNGSTTATAVNNGSSDACGIASLVLSQVNFACSEVGANTETLTVTDVNGNVSTCTTIVTVEDNVAPVAICQDVTVQLDATGNGSTTATAVNNGSSDACGIASIVLSQTAFNCSEVGGNTETLTVTDVNGNVSTCTTIVTVEDNVAPVAICQDVTVQLDANGNGSTTATIVDNGSSDACGIASLVLSQTAFNCSEVGVNAEILTVTDINGNVSTCSTTVTVEDNVAPVAICQDVTVQLDATGNGSTTASAVDNGSSDACGIASLVLSQTNFACSEVGTNTETLTVTDVNGNVTTCTTTITVEDNVAPVAICQDVTVQLDATGTGSTTAAAVNNGSSDACGIASIVLSQTTFGCSEVGSNIETLTVTDVNGNVSTCTATITVEDNVAPVATCQNVTVQLDEFGFGATTAVEVDNGSTDACGLLPQCPPSGPMVACLSGLMLDKSVFDCSEIGSNTVTLTVTDQHYNSSTCTSIVTVEDNIAPVAICQDVTVQLDNTGSGTVSAAQVDNGSSDACGIESMVLSQTVFVCGEVGSNTVTLTVTDVNGNVSTCTATVLLEDNIAPVAICQDVTIQLDAIGNGSTTATAVDNGSSDACGIASLVLSQTAFVCSEVGANTETLTVTDVNGNVTTCTATITVEDNVAPVAICQDVTVQLDAAGNGSTTATAVDNGSSDACGIASLVLSQTAFVCSEVGANTETLTVTDVNGNVTTCTATITVEDNIAPVAICQDVTVQLDATGNGSTTATAVDNGSSDACGIASLVLSQTAFVCSEVGANTETLTVTDVNGNVTTCTVTITVEDNIAPVAICQDVTIQLDATGNGSTTATAVDNGSSDACGIASLVLSQTAFVCSEVGANTETLTVTDVNGNVTTCTATITVEDNIAPVAICQDVTVQLDATGNGSTTATAVDNGSSDACGIASLVLSQTAFVCSEVGANTETLTVTDVNGNVTTCTATITVEDNVAPVAICQDVTVQLDATGNGSTTALAVDNGSSDACGIASLVLSQTAFVCSEVGANTETLTVTDVNGNVTTCTATITVEDNVAPVAICQDVTVQLDATGNGSTTATTVDNGSSDACGIASLVLSQTAFVCSEVGANTETLTVTDVNGNVTTCTATITVEDNIAPVAICQDVTVQLDAAGNGSTTATAVDNGSSDACGIASLVLSQTAFACSEVGANTETLTVTDVNGNVSTCTTTITVEDNIAPVAICQDVTVQLDATGNGSTTATAVDNGSSDACGIASLVLSQTAFVCSEVGANTETLTVTDVNGNVTTCTVTITVEDDIAPVAICQDVTVQLDATGNGSTTATAVDNGSSDACGIASLVLSQTAFVCSEVGANTETLTVTDVNGNVTTCTATITVEDNIAPIALCQDVTLQLSASGSASTTATAVDNGSSDACGITLTLSKTTFNCSNVGSNPVVLSVTDANGNLTTCNAVVTIQDVTSPTFTCPPSQTVTAAAGQLCKTVTWATPVASDNCSATLTSNYNSGFCFPGSISNPVNTTIVTYTAVDPSGNTTTCSFNVNVSLTCSNTTWAGVIGCGYGDDDDDDNGHHDDDDDGHHDDDDDGNHDDDDDGDWWWWGHNLTDGQGNTSSSIVKDAGGITSSYASRLIGNENGGIADDWGWDDDDDDGGHHDDDDDGHHGGGHWGHPHHWWNHHGWNHNYYDYRGYRPGGKCYDNNENHCGGVDPDTIGNIASPVGGTGAIEYQWLKSTVGVPTTLADAIPGATSAFYDPPYISQTTYFVRLTRRSACTDTDWIASNAIRIRVFPDVIRPDIDNCPDNITLNTTDLNCKVATWTAPTASDECTLVSFTSNYNSGYCFPVGNTNVTYTATDGGGNTSTCTFRVRILAPCYPVTNGGTVSMSCVSGSVEIGTLTFPSGGSGTLEYEWRKSTVNSNTNSNTWSVIPGENSATLSVGSVAQTTYYARFAKRLSCSNWTASNVVSVTPNACASNCSGNVLFVAGTTTLNAADNALRTRIQNLGYTVTVMDDNVTTNSSANGNVLVVISNTIAASTVGTKFRDVTVPVIVLDGELFSNMRMVSNGSSNYGSTNLTNVSVVNGHPIAGSLSGSTQVYTSSQAATWGRPTASAVTIAQNSSTAANKHIFAYESGSAMVSQNAPQRRVGFFVATTNSALSANGNTLFDNAVKWATGCLAGSFAPTAPVAPAAIVEPTVTTPASSARQSDGGEIRLNAYPNPFKYNTMISFTVTESTDNATLKVYNLEGMEVKQLYDGPAAAEKEYKFEFNVDNTFDSGIYFYRVETKEGKAAVNKLILLK